MLHSLQGDLQGSEFAAASLVHWNSELDTSPHTPPHSSPLTHTHTSTTSSSSLSTPHPHTTTGGYLNGHFFLLNVAKTTDVDYNAYNYTSCDEDFTLRLFVSGLPILLREDLVVVTKHYPSNSSSTSGRHFPLHSDLAAMETDVDSLAVSLHDSTPSLLGYPGPYLLEHYLYHKSPVLFPSARSPNHPVLMVDRYVNLGTGTYASFVLSSALENRSFLTDEEAVSIRFGGLVLYLCEGKVSAQQLHRLNFVAGACLCLVTQDSQSLVGEVGRLDLEERWKFRLRDEYKTACPYDPLHTPLFFLIGRFGQ